VRSNYAACFGIEFLVWLAFVAVNETMVGLNSTISASAQLR